MAAPTLYKAAGNEFSTTLASPATDSDLSLELSSVAGLETGGGILILDEGVVASEEVVAYTSYVGTTVTIPSGGRGLSGTSAHSHAIGATVKDILVSEHVNKLITSFTAEHSEAGVHSAATVTSLKATTAEIETGTSDVKVITPLGLASSEYGQYHNSMSRQAIINGNFDIWQRGTSVTNPADAVYLADRWATRVGAGGGTLPTSIIHSRQALTAGDIPNSFYFYRVAPNGAGTSLGVTSYGFLNQGIEYGTRNLCGASKTVSVSFYARSSIANKRLTPTLVQNYGTGGSPTAEEYIKGTPITLTSSWVKYTATFTTNTLVGKTFGTANDDFLALRFWYMWGTTYGNDQVQTSVTQETFVGSGNIDIAQVQLCAGDVALPFQPKSYNQELLDCERYCYDLTGGSALANIVLSSAYASSTTNAYVDVPLPVQMRIAPTLATMTPANLSIGYWSGANTALTNFVVGIASPSMVQFAATVASGLTANAGMSLYRPGTTEKVIVTAEL